MATNSTLALHPRDIPVTEPRAPSARKPGLLRRVFDALIASRQREAERIVAAHLARSGMKLTDTAEREIESFLAGSGYRLH